MLQKFRKSKEAEIGRLVSLGEGALRERISQAFPFQEGRRAVPDFLAALQKGKEGRSLAVIAEYKRASPSRGDIFLGLGPEEVAESYAKADAISVLTEEGHFKGNLAFLGRMGKPQIPLLRKDFIFHPFQVLDTAATKASAILLIVRLLNGLLELREMIGLSYSLGLLPLVEVFGAEDLLLARKAGAKALQVNSRDLSTMKVDFQGSLSLIADYPPLEGEFWVGASGVLTGNDLLSLKDAGYGAALVGTALMEGGRPRENLDKLLSALDPTSTSSAPRGPHA
jgi:indole-3-glycerol phosphate synthase